MTPTSHQTSAQQHDGVLDPLNAVLEDDLRFGEAFITEVRNTVQRLVVIDVRSGGNAASALALQAFSAVRHQLGSGAFPVRHRQDLYAAAAELAEITGWLLCDANRHVEAHRMNQIAVILARRCGDRLMELFVLHNMSLQATYLRRPSRALEIVQPVLERGRLTPRLTSMFRLRAARAHAQMGLETEAFRIRDDVRSLLLDGVCDRDPSWAWWVSPRGLTFATAAMHGSLRDWKRAISPLHQALEETSANAFRDRFLYLCVMLHAQIEAGALRDAQASAQALAPLIGAVGSERPLARLWATIERVRELRVPKVLAAVEPVIETMRIKSPGLAPDHGRFTSHITPAAPTASATDCR
jgi:hypothetical protein